MDINNLETFKGLISKFDIDDSKKCTTLHDVALGTSYIIYYE